MTTSEPSPEKADKAELPDGGLQPKGASDAPSHRCDATSSSTSSANDQPGANAVNTSKGIPLVSATGWRQLGRQMKRRPLLTAVFAMIGAVLSSRVLEQVNRVTDPVVDAAGRAIRDALGGDIVSSDLTVSVIGYGTLPPDQWEKAKDDPRVYDTWYSSSLPKDFIPFEGKIAGNIVADRGVYLKAVRYKEIQPRRPVGDRRAVLTVGGGDGDPLHAYIVIKDPPAIRYAQGGGVPASDVFFRVSEDPDSPSFLSISVLVVPPVIVELSIQLIFQRSGQQEFSQLEFGPIKASGPPVDGSPELQIVGTSGGTTQVSSFDTHKLQQTLESLNIAQ